METYIVITHLKVLQMSTHNIFFWETRKISAFLVEKSALSETWKN